MFRWSERQPAFPLDPPPNDTQTAMNTVTTEMVTTFVKRASVAGRVGSEINPVATTATRNHRYVSIAKWATARRLRRGST